MKEKVMYVKLPEGAEYRKVIVTEDGSIGIVYSEECKCQCKKTKVAIPKPKALIGGSEVYHKEGIPYYWYCKIKDGRDEFMYVHMEDLTVKDLLIDYKTGKDRIFASQEQKSFMNNVLKALERKPRKGGRWIPVFEPSPSPEGGVQFIKGAQPWVHPNIDEWRQMFYEYSPENGSQQSSATTYFLLSLRWLKDGMATLEQLTEDSKDIGHYKDSPNAKHELELTGEREFGGLYGFAGNTCKIVDDLDSLEGYSILGGTYKYYGDSCPVNDIIRVSVPNKDNEDSIGLLELKG